MDGANKETENSAYCTSSFFYAKLCASGYMEVASWIKVCFIGFVQLHRLIIGLLFSIS